jgi:hypothetical protein
MVHRGQSSLSTKSLRRCWQPRHSSRGTGKPRRLAAPPSSHPSCRKDFDQSRAEGPVSGKRKRKNKKTLIAYAVEFVEGNFPRNQALQDRRIVLCERDRRGGLEGSRGSTGREALTAYLWICGNNSIETAPQRTGPRTVEDSHACTPHSNTALLLATPPGYYPHRISKCLGSAIQGWRGVREWQRMPSCQTLCRCTRQDEALKESLGHLFNLTVR